MVHGQLVLSGPPATDSQRPSSPQPAGRVGMPRHTCDDDHHHHPPDSSINAQEHRPRLTQPQCQVNQLPHDIFTISDHVLASQYSFDKEIGYGNWGSIWRVSINQHHLSHSKNLNTLAVKLVHRDRASSTTPAKIKSLWGEFKILRQFKQNPHKNVLRVSSFIITPSYAILTMNYHPHNLPVKLSELHPKTTKYLIGLCSALDFLHRNGVAHNDLKPANVVLSFDDQPVLVDFGFATAYGLDFKDYPEKKPFWSSLSWGTPEYLSPQRAKGEWHDERLSDIWSLGIMFYEIVVGRTPFEETESEEFVTKEALEVYYQRTLKGDFLGSYTLSKDLKDLLASMIRPDPAQRLGSCKGVLAHSYFSSLNSPPFSKSALIESRVKMYEQNGPAKNVDVNCSLSKNAKVHHPVTSPQITPTLNRTLSSGKPHPSSPGLVNLRIQQLSLQGKSSTQSTGSVKVSNGEGNENDEHGNRDDPVGTNVSSTPRPKYIAHNNQRCSMTTPTKSNFSHGRPRSILGAKSTNTPDIHVSPRKSPRRLSTACSQVKDAKPELSSFRSMRIKRVPVPKSLDVGKENL